MKNYHVIYREGRGKPLKTMRVVSPLGTRETGKRIHHDLKVTVKWVGTDTSVMLYGIKGYEHFSNTYLGIEEGVFFRIQDLYFDLMQKVEYVIE